MLVWEIKKMNERDIIRAIAVDWVCPINHNPTTSYEIGEVNRLIKFAEDILIALNNPIDKGKP